jgi:hypothetical protein
MCARSMKLSMALSPGSWSSRQIPPVLDGETVGECDLNG